MDLCIKALLWVHPITKHDSTCDTWSKLLSVLLSRPISLSHHWTG